NEKVAGVSVPDRYINMMAQAKKEERAKVSVQIAAELIKGMKGLCQGIHIMPLGWEKYVPLVLEAAEL
ncbi:MAG TPA: 5,10-methylenetetrahydrofolate reductase, partial [bacterium]|nr:5,10-methylenetetrahydrofolate reductase [bacterium]